MKNTKRKRLVSIFCSYICEMILCLQFPILLQNFMTLSSYQQLYDGNSPLKQDPGHPPVMIPLVLLETIYHHTWQCPLPQCPFWLVMVSIYKTEVFQFKSMYNFLQIYHRKLEPMTLQGHALNLYDIVNLHQSCFNTTHELMQQSDEVFVHMN